MQSENPGSGEQTQPHKTVAYPLQFKPMAEVQENLRKKHGFSDDQAAGVTMAIHDTVTLVIERLGTFETHVDERFVEFESRMNERFADFETRMTEGFRDVKRNTRWHTAGVVLTIVVATLVQYFG